MAITIPNDISNTASTNGHTNLCTRFAHQPHFKIVVLDLLRYSKGIPSNSLLTHSEAVQTMDSTISSIVLLFIPENSIIPL